MPYYNTTDYEEGPREFDEKCTCDGVGTDGFSAVDSGVNLRVGQLKVYALKWGKHDVTMIAEERIETILYLYVQESTCICTQCMWCVEFDGHSMGDLSKEIAHS